MVAEQRRVIKVFDVLGDTSAQVIDDNRTEVHNWSNRGLLGLELDPDFPAQPYVYALYSRDAAIGGAAPLWGTAGANTDGCVDPPRVPSEPNPASCPASGRLDGSSSHPGAARWSIGRP